MNDYDNPAYYRMSLEALDACFQEAKDMPSSNFKNKYLAMIIHGSCAEAAARFWEKRCKELETLVNQGAGI